MAAPTIGFFGSTGGCALAALTQALNARYHCTALVRDAEKLKSLLASKKVPEETVNSQLRIVKGNVKDTSAVAQALVIDGRVVDLVVSGIGSAFSMKPNPLKPTILEPTICEDATNIILSSLKTLASAHKPALVVISTTGLSRFGRDLPLAMVPLYHWMLGTAHADKRAMEDILLRDAKDPDKSPISNYAIVRASLLTDGKMLGVQKVRVGTEIEGDDGTSQEFNPAIGYTISRADVGNWIFEKIIKSEDRAERLGKVTILTY
ncbi:MAG: hypothetical protein M1833_000169 [Piccolia ochrophora]|nr:MAG: hypothetical protein M1833_000169 [Piccolia ochrophora]